tara:strand:+ start:15 stop:593 length:579 start_codon:yes stop_codon:yes gene_type:complete
MNNLNFLSLKFVASFEKYDQIFEHKSKEIAFVGASNSGKSSAINAISNQNKLAKVSKKPGKTKLFNFFNAPNGYIVDFPGYGYAKTSKQQIKVWGVELPKYFERRNSLCFVYIFTDVRHPLKNMDYQMIELLKKNRINYKIILTKSDKLNQKNLSNIITDLQKEFPNLDYFSIKDKQQVLRIAQEINELLSN